VRKVLTCGAATPRDETPLARFHADNNPPRLTAADDGLPRLMRGAISFTVVEKSRYGEIVTLFV